MANPEFHKPIHSLVLDTGPLIQNDPPASVLIAKAEQLYTHPAVISEIRDAATRSRVETTLLPFITIRAPGRASVRFVQEFARRTGDLDVLSRTDIEVLALAYELECERNGGDWRLRKVPGQERINGAPPRVEGASGTGGDGDTGDLQTEEDQDAQANEGDEATGENGATEPAERDEAAGAGSQKDLSLQAQEPSTQLEDDMQNLDLNHHRDSASPAPPNDAAEPDTALEPQTNETTDAAPASSQDTTPDDASDSDSDGWITPSNLKKHQAADSAPSSTRAPKPLQAAVLTSDYAMQNVALRINLNLVTPSLSRITRLRTWVLRCHGCFAITRDTARQFCAKCGQATLLRTSCSTDASGKVTVHLKHNFQWNTRGNVYSVPKPVCGSASGRVKTKAGKNPWGQGLILAEDQKEYTRAAEERRRVRQRDIMDQDYLPGLMGGDRQVPGERIRVGAGRNVNSRRKR